MLAQSQADNAAKDQELAQLRARLAATQSGEPGEGVPPSSKEALDAAVRRRFQELRSQELTRKKEDGTAEKND